MYLKNQNSIHNYKKNFEAVILQKKWSFQGYENYVLLSTDNPFQAFISRIQLYLQIFFKKVSQLFLFMILLDFQWIKNSPLFVKNFNESRCRLIIPKRFFSVRSSEILRHLWLFACVTWLTKQPSKNL